MLQIFEYDFLIRAFLAGLITAVIAPMIGTFLVVRRYSLMADTLAHVSLVGVAIGIIAKLDPILTSLVTTVLAGLGIERLRQAGKFFGESVLAIFLSGGLALAIVLISAFNGLNVNIFNFLFGSINTVSTNDLYTIAIVGFAIVVTITLFYRQLFFISLNEELAEANGIHTKVLNFVLITLAAVTVSVSIRMVGVLLIGALMIIPVVTAIQFGRGFLKTMVWSIFISLTCVIGGLFASFYLNLATGGIIVLIALVVFMLTLLVNYLCKN